MAISVKRITKMFTCFYDMHSGGSSKEEWSVIYIELPEEQACVYFQNRFGHNPRRVSCTCCGSDYSIWETEELMHERPKDTRLVIHKEDITPEDYEGELREEGYIWK
jgi:hypothetical protein